MRLPQSGRGASVSPNTDISRHWDVRARLRGSASVEVRTNRPPDVWPEAVPGIACSNEAVTLSVIGGGTHQWSPNAGLVPWAPGDWLTPKPSAPGAPTAS